MTRAKAKMQLKGKGEMDRVLDNWDISQLQKMSEVHLISLILSTRLREGKDGEYRRVLRGCVGGMK